MDILFISATGADSAHENELRFQNKLSMSGTHLFEFKQFLSLFSFDQLRCRLVVHYNSLCLL